MKYMKKYESFDMHRDNCDRCNQPTNNSTIMSMFNDEIICMKCKAEEKNDPNYQLAELRDRIEYYNNLVKTYSASGDYEQAARYKKLSDEAYNKVYN